MRPFTLLLMILGLIFALWGFGDDSIFEPNLAVCAPDLALVEGEPVRTERAVELDDENGREEAEGLPVPIVPGTRVTEARIAPPVHSPSRTTVEAKIHQVGASLPPGIRLVAGRLSATEERARADARLQLEREVTECLTPEVPTSWTPPGHLISRMIRKTEVHPIVKDYGTVYEAILEADIGSRRGDIVAAYEREVVGRRLGVLGGSLGFALVCLAGLAGYIRTDEATRGYYTYWLRAITAAGVGASGVVIYQLLT